MSQGRVLGAAQTNVPKSDQIDFRARRPSVAMVTLHTLYGQVMGPAP